jgi:nucleotide-binding universal stress UspA family protein
MTELSNIVVGVDGRPGGWDGLALARRLARLDGGRLTVVCAFPALGFDHAPLMWGDIVSEDDARRVLDDARTHLDDGVADVSAVAGAMPAVCLHDAAARSGADVLVVGGAQHGAVGRALGASVLAEVLVDPPCPVAVAPRGRTSAITRLRHVGVAVDGSAASLAAIRWAHDLAERHESVRELHLIAVDDHARSHVTAVGRGELLARAGHGNRAGSEALEVRWTHLAGPPAGELAERSLQLDLLVIGTHGRGGLSRLLHGSVSRDIAQRARCPVVVVPDGERAAPG